MSVTINGTTGVSAVQDGVVTAADLASTLDLSGKTVTLAAGGTGYGKVLQVVSTTAQTASISTTSTSFVSTGVSISITPTSATSKILVVFNTCAHLNTAQNSGDAQEGYYTIYRGATNLGDASMGLIWARLYGNGAVSHYSEYPLSLQAVDAPNTTSSVTYTSYFRSSNAAETVGYSYQTFVQTIYAMEIAA